MEEAIPYLNTEKTSLDYHFKTINDFEYTLNLTMNIKNRLLNYIFQQSKIQLTKKDISTTKTPTDINKFDIPQRYLKLIRTILNKQLRTIEAEVRRDRIKVITSDIKKCFFEKDTNMDWIVNITFEGEYIEC